MPARPAKPAKPAKPPKPVAPDPIGYRVFDMQPSKGDRRKLEIIEAAIHCLATLGIAETSLEAIGKVLGIKSGHIVYHFKDKATLLDAVLKYINAVGAAVFIEHAQAGGTPEAQLQGYINGMFAWFERYPEHARITVFFYYCATYDLALREIQSTIWEAAFERVKALIEPLHARAKAKAGRGTSIPTLDESARHFYCALRGYGIEILSTGSKRSLPDWKTEVSRTLAHALFDRS